MKILHLSGASLWIGVRLNTHFQVKSGKVEDRYLLS